MAQHWTEADIPDQTGRTALVTNSASHQLEAVNVSQLG